MRNFHLELQSENLKSLNGQLVYVNEALSRSDIEAWETKEYKGVKEDILVKIANTESLINTIKSMA